MKLREYQKKHLWELFNELTHHEAVLLQASTGTGKGFQMAYIFQQCLKAHKQIMFVVHGKVVIDAFCDELSDNNIPHTRFQAGHKYDSTERAVVASIDTIKARYFSKRAKRPKDELPVPAYLLVDECRKIANAGALPVLEWYKEHGTQIIGFDATPDAPGLGDIYDILLPGNSTAWHIKNGDLVPVIHYAPNATDRKFLDEVKNLKVRGGEFVEKELAQIAQNQVLVGNIVEQYERISEKEFGDLRRFVVACTNKAHAQSVQAAFLNAGHEVAYIDGNTPQQERNEIKKKMENGEILGIISVLVMIYGANWKFLEIAILARLTKKASVMLQFGGRVLRTYPDKEKAVFIDMGTAIHDIGFIDDEYEWVLCANLPINKTREQREHETSVEHVDITCGGCGFVYKNAAQCPKCGTKNIISPNEIGVVYYNKELVRLENERQAREQKHREHQDFIARTKNFITTKYSNLPEAQRLQKFNQMVQKKCGFVLTQEHFHAINDKPYDSEIVRWEVHTNYVNHIIREKRRKS